MSPRRAARYSCGLVSWTLTVAQPPADNDERAMPSTNVRNKVAVPLTAGASAFWLSMTTFCSATCGGQRQVSALGWTSARRIGIDHRPGLTASRLWEYRRIGRYQDGARLDERQQERNEPWR